MSAACNATYSPNEPQWVNPGWVWSDYLANYYGTNAQPNGNGQVGDNYAAGGARVDVDVGNPLSPLLPPIPSLKSQLNS